MRNSDCVNSVSVNTMSKRERSYQLPKLTASEKKRRKVLRCRRFRQQQINIGDQVERWQQLRTDLNIQTNRDFAQILLDFYITNVEKPKPYTTSTPHRIPSISRLAMSVSEVSSVSDASEPMSGIEVLSEDSNGYRPSSTTVAMVKDKEWKSRYRIDIAGSEAVDSESALSEYRDPDDPTYDDECDISISDSLLPNCDDELDITDDIHNITVVSDDDDDDNTKEAQHEKMPAGVQDLKRATLDTVTAARHIVEEPCLVQLAGLLPLKVCQRKGCAEPVTLSTKKCATALYIKWVCSAGHLVYRWCTQSRLPNGVLTGNFLFCSSVVLSGNNYAKLALFGRFLNMGVPGRSSFTRIQTHYVVPQVNRYWEMTQAGILRQLKDKEVVIAGDGRMDSPGYCAHYCTYTIMDQSDKRILAMKVVDKRQTSLKSTLMEADGFKRGLAEIQIAGIKVKEIVTDAHPQISSIMKKQYSTIRHSYDMWHGAKNFGKKLIAAANEKENKELKPWSKDITNHFWFCAQECNGDVDQFLSKWVSVLQHVVDVHKWALGECAHGPLDEEERSKSWMIANSPPHIALRKLVFNPRFLRTVPYYLTCQSTSELESFNNHILMYASKRQSFTFPVYKCRCQLAAIDYQKHLDRPYQKTKAGKDRYCRQYSKAARHWTAVQVKVPKEYGYIPNLQQSILDTFCLQHKEIQLSSKVSFSSDDPRRIARTIAPEEPIPTATIVSEHKKRVTN